MRISRQTPSAPSATRPASTSHSFLGLGDPTVEVGDPLVRSARTPLAATPTTEPSQRSPCRADQRSGAARRTGAPRVRPRNALRLLRGMPPLRHGHAEHPADPRLEHPAAENPRHRATPPGRSPLTSRQTQPPACRQALRQPAAACSSTIFRSVERGVIVMTGGHVDSHSSRSATEASPVGGYGVRGHGGSPPPSGPDGRAARRAVASTAGSGRPRHGRVARGWPEVSSTATSASSNAQKSSTGGCRRPAPVGMTPMPGTGRRRQRAPHPGSDIPQFTRPDAGRIHRR